MILYFGRLVRKWHTCGWGTDYSYGGHSVTVGVVNETLPMMVIVETARRRCVVQRR